MSAIQDPAPPGDKFTEAQAHNHYLLVYVVEYVDQITTKYGDRDAIKLNVADLTTNEHYTNVLWFGGAIIGALKQQVGQLVLGQITQGVASGGNKPPWLFSTVTDEQVRAAANKWLEGNPGVLQGIPAVVVNAAPGGISGALA